MPVQKKKYKDMKKWQIASIIAVGCAIIAVIVAAIVYFSMPIKYHTVVFDEENKMTVVDQYRTFTYARKGMLELIEEGKFNPAVIDEEENLVAIRYGVLDFKTKTASENTYFTYDNDDTTGYLNGNYGADAVYIDTNNDCDAYKFKMSGAVGWVSKNDVRLLNYFDGTQVLSLNHYEVSATNELHHYGTYQVDNADYKLVLNIGDKPSYMTGDVYYSYDGHYFYKTYTEMADDYRNDTYKNSINPDNPYFNYYQFLSARTQSNYMTMAIDDYIEKNLGYKQKPTALPMETDDSQLFGEGTNFIKYQNEYGSNAIMMLSLAINESGFGRSEIAFTKNNLFGHAAYDNAPGENANGYATVGDSIMTHAKVFISEAYLNPCDNSEKVDAKACSKNESSRYAGAFFGDKGSGMGVNYASDPYWGEKAASYYRKFDRENGYHDATRFKVKMMTNQGNVDIYSDAKTSSNVLYKTPDVPFYTVVVLEEVKGEAIDGNDVWYKIQSDTPINSDRTAMNPMAGSYNFTTDYAYIHSSYFTNKK